MSLYVIITLTLIFSATITVINSAKLPPQFTKCSSKDGKCLKQSIDSAIRQLDNGLPKYGLIPLNPLTISELTIGAGKSVVNVEQIYKNVHLIGATDGVVENVKLDMENGIFDIDFNNKLLKMDADYRMNGRILIIPVMGHGKCSITLRDSKPSFRTKFDVISKRGKKFMRIKSENYTLNAGSASYNFENIFNGDKLLGDEINRVINQNWKEIYDEVVPGYETAIGMLFTNVANRFLAKVPISEMFC